MLVALLYQIQVRYLTKRKVEITLVPNKLGRWLRRSVRTGVAKKGQSNEGEQCWWWQATDRHVGDYIEKYIEAAPVLSIEDMPIELLLKEGTDD
jgi:hypothetical protein